MLIMQTIQMTASLEWKPLKNCPKSTRKLQRQHAYAKRCSYTSFCVKMLNQH